jgi:hypothetical protein
LAGLFEAPNGTSLDADTNPIQRFEASPFAAIAQQDYRVLPTAVGQLAAPATAAEAPLPAMPGAAQPSADSPLRWQYLHPADKQQRAAADRMILGAGGRAE